MKNWFKMHTFSLGAHMVEEPSPEKILPKSIDPLPTRLVGPLNPLWLADSATEFWFNCHTQSELFNHCLFTSIRMALWRTVIPIQISATCSYGISISDPVVFREIWI